LNLAFDANVILIYSYAQSIHIGGSPSVVVVQLDGSKDAQPSIEVEEDAHESVEVDEEDELSIDQIRAGGKVNSIATIEAIRLKPSLLSRMLILLCRLVAMPIVRPTLFSDLANQ
jgi:hypothetical protein